MKNSLILGFFDGVHLAHQAVIQSGLQGHAILITFKTSPSAYFNEQVEYILSRENSYQKIMQLGISDIVELDFPNIVNISAEEYLENLVKKYSPAYISTGFNHTFGLNKTGDANFLIKHQTIFGYKYFCVPPLKDENDIISSTLIKKILKDGNIERANKLLGGNFILSGTVVHGKQLASKLGFPTANFYYPKDIVKIPFGVYCVKAFGKPAILNWGVKPTINDNDKPILEVYIPNYTGNLYGKELRVEIIKKIRDERKFNSAVELKAQIEEDVKLCLE